MTENYIRVKNKGKFGQLLCSRFRQCLGDWYGTQKYCNICSKKNVNPPHHPRGKNSILFSYNNYEIPKMDDFCAGYMVTNDSH